MPLNPRCATPFFSFMKSVQCSRLSFTVLFTFDDLYFVGVRADSSMCAITGFKTFGVTYFDIYDVFPPHHLRD